jgi:hypothetical protein
MQAQATPQFQFLLLLLLLLLLVVLSIQYSSIYECVSHDTRKHTDRRAAGSDLGFESGCHTAV